MRTGLAAGLAGVLLLGCGAVVAQGTGAPAPLGLPKRVTCPVDQKSFDAAPSSLSIQVNGSPQYFCSAACRDRFVGWPEKYLKGPVYCVVQPSFKGWLQTGRRVEVNNGLYYLCCDPCVGYLREKPWFYLKDKEILDPVSGHAFKPTEATPRADASRQIYLFESSETKAQFEKEPGKYVVTFRR